MFLSRNVVYSLGLLMGIGGSVIFSTVRGQKTGNENEYFTVSVIGSVMLAIMSWLAILFFEKPILLFFSADSSLLPLAESYLTPIKVVIPLFLFNQMLAVFLRNDDHPGFATAGVLAGGLFNAAPIAWDRLRSRSFLSILVRKNGNVLKRLCVTPFILLARSAYFGLLSV